jgi:hypothetical protein
MRLWLNFERMMSNEESSNCMVAVPDSRSARQCVSQGTQPKNPMKTSHNNKTLTQANPSKAHSTASWTRNMSASGKGHRRHPGGGIGGKNRALLLQGGSTHLG